MLKKGRALVACACAWAALGTSAAVDLDAVSPTVPIYARETLSSASATQGIDDGVTYYNVAAAAGNNDVTSVLGVGITAGQQFYVRFDLDNGVLAAGNNAALTIAGGSNISVAKGGAVGDSFIAYAVTAVVGLSQGDSVTLNLDALGISNGGPVSVTYSLYETLTAAVFRGDSLYENTLANYINTAAGAVSSFTLGENTAEVSSNFRNFTSGSISGTRANIGSFAYEPVPGVFAATDGLQVAASDVANQVQTDVLLSGDFSMGSWSLDNDAACTSPDFDLGPVIAAGNGSELEVSLLQFGSNGFSNLCLNVDGIDDEIPVEEYTASADVVAVNPQAVNAPADISGLIGNLLRNGTVLRLPSLTTFPDYNQRIVIVNYRDIEIEYALDFLAEEGVTASPLEAATGILQPDQKLVLRVSDVVAISGGSRCAATLAAKAREGSVSVATTQVNLSTGSTDTVVYR